MALRAMSTSCRRFVVLVLILLSTYLLSGIPDRSSPVLTSDQVTQQRELRNEHLLAVAGRIQKENGFVYLMFVNSGFSLIVKNWVCNVVSLNERILLRTLFVATDLQTVRELNIFLEELQIFVVSSVWTMGASFGSFEYYNIVLERMKVQNALIQAGISVHIIEADQIWQIDISPLISTQLKRCDVVVVHEGADMLSDENSAIKVCGGFYGVRASKRTKSFFNSYVSTYAAMLSNFANETAPLYLLPTFSDDQDHLTKMLIESNLTVKLAPKCFYAHGLWYDDTKLSAECPRPHILHNNYIIGTDNKIKRAKRHDQWFLLQSDGKEECLQSSS